MGLLFEYHTYTLYTTLSIAVYSKLQLRELRQRRMKQTAQASKDYSNTGSLDFIRIKKDFLNAAIECYTL